MMVDDTKDDERRSIPFPLCGAEKDADVVVVETRSIRLLELGLTAGTELRVIQRLPLRGPITIDVRGYRLVLDHEAAALVLVSNAA